MMPDKSHREIQDLFGQLDAAAPPHDLPASGQVWSRLQFRLAYRPRKDSDGSDTGSLLVAAYVLAFLIWTYWSGWLSAGLIAALASAAAAAAFLLLRVSRYFRS